MDTSITPLSTTVSSSSADNAPQPQQNQFMEPLPPPSVAETEYTLSPVPSSKATEKKGRFTIKNVGFFFLLMCFLLTIFHFKGFKVTV